jgi:hypothetical protein
MNRELDQVPSPRRGLDDEPAVRLPRPTLQHTEGKMADILQWIALALGAGVIALGIAGFFRGFSLTPNTPEHRSRGKGDRWRVD